MDNCTIPELRLAAESLLKEIELSEKKDKG
jgi:hypothetical protein